MPSNVECAIMSILVAVVGFALTWTNVVVTGLRSYRSEFQFARSATHLSGNELGLVSTIDYVASVGKLIKVSNA